MKGLICCTVLLSSIFACGRKLPVKAAAVSSEDLIAVLRSIPGISAPACILQKIDSIKKQPVWNPPAEIQEYEYEGKKVYAISANCCDFFTTVVDADCKYVCAPSGGFTGRGDGKCLEFFKEAKNLRLVWKDERSRK